MTGLAVATLAAAASSAAMAARSSHMANKANKSARREQAKALSAAKATQRNAEIGKAKAAVTPDADASQAAAARNAGVHASYLASRQAGAGARPAGATTTGAGI